MTTSLAGVFNPRARAAIFEATQGRCAGCGRLDVTTQHRRARGMGGTSDVSIGHPANGVALCGDGIRGCHGWAERWPKAAALLGWRLEPGQAVTEPWWSRAGWRRWVLEPDGFVSVAYVDELEDLDRFTERQAAIARYQRDRPLPAKHDGKPTR